MASGQPTAPHVASTRSAWRLVDHIKDVKEGDDLQQREAVKAILGIWSEVDKLLTQKAGLTYGAPPPASFGKALAHSAMLRMFWELGQNQPPDNRLPFPGEEFDSDINDAIVKIRAKLVKLRPDLAVRAVDAAGSSP